jgi:hypothetical protein
MLKILLIVGLFTITLAHKSYDVAKLAMKPFDAPQKVNEPRPPVPVAQVSVAPTKVVSIAKPQLVRVPVAKPQRVVKVPVPMTIVDAPLMRVYPKFVQQLSDTQFKNWATWQNSQAEIRKQAGGSYVPQYLGGSREITIFDSPSGPRGHKGGVGFIETRSMPSSYLNNEYTGPGPIIISNPYVRATGVGEPNWNEFFVPCEGGAMTVAEVIAANGPADAETLFTKLMAPYFQ